MSDKYRRLSIIWAVVTGVLLGGLIIVPMLGVSSMAQIIIVGGLYVAYLLVLLIGAVRYKPKPDVVTRRTKPVRFQRYPQVLPLDATPAETLAGSALPQTSKNKEGNSHA